MHQEDDNIVCTMEDLIFIKPGNKVKLEYRKNKYPLEVYVLYIGGELLRKLSDEETRLDEAFDFVPYQVKIVHSETESAMLIKNISNNISYDAVSLIFSVLYMIGCALIAVSMFASVPVLTAVGGGLALLNAVRSLISFIKLVALDSNYLSIALFNISLAAFQVVFFILIIIAGLNKKSAKVLGITAASVYGVRLLVYIICRLINYGYISMGLTAWLHYLFMILGAVMLGLVLYDMQAGYSAAKRPRAQVSDAELFSGNGPLDQLGKAKMLLDAGVISKEEFTARKRNILGL